MMKLNNLRSDLFPFHNNTITELQDRHSLKKLNLPLPSLMASGLLKNNSLPEVDLRLPSLGEMLLIMEHIPEDMVPSDGILTTLTMKELAIVVDKKSQDYFSIFNFSSLNFSYFYLILPKLSFLLSYRKINFVDIFLKINKKKKKKKKKK